MGRLTHPVVDTTAVLESLSGDYQFWTLENPDTNAQSIFYNQNATASTTATQSKPVRPGQTAFFFVNAWDNPNGVSLIAATAAQTVNLVKETFRTRLGYQIAVLAAGVAASVANLWRTVAGSTTAVELNGAFTEARADTVRNKTAGTGLGIYTDAAATGIALRPGTAPTVNASEVNIYSPDGTDRQYVLNGNIVQTTNSIDRFVVRDADVHVRNSPTFIHFEGAGTDPRHTLTSAHRVLHTPVAGGAIDSVLDTIERPIDDGVVLAAGNSLVMVSATTGRLALATTANVTQGVLGICVVGGTGNAGGTVFGRVGILGWFYGILADAAGVVGGQFVKPGTTTANQVESQTTPSLITFGRALITRASGVATELYLRGMG